MSIKILKFSVVIIAFVAVSFFLKEITSFAVPVVFGAIIGFIFSSVVEWLKNKKVPSILTIPITIIIFLIVSGFFIYIAFALINSFVGRSDFYQQQGSKIIAVIAEKVPFIEGQILLDAQDKIFNFITNSVVSFSRGIITFLSAAVVTIFVMVFVLLERNFLSFKLIEMFSNEQRGLQANKAVGSMNTQVSQFIFLKFLISLFTGVIIYISFNMIGVDFPIMWGLLTIAFNFIPSVGSILITVVSILFSMLQFFPEWGNVIAVSVVTLSTQMIIGNVLDPLITGNRLNLSPLIIFLSLLYWGWVWGIGGMFLAVPIVVIVQVICESLGFHHISVAMSNPRAIWKQVKHQHEHIEENT